MMTPKELIAKLVALEGPCERLCSYCPEEVSTSEIRKCVEKMIETIYKLQMDNDALLDDFVKLRAVYKEATGLDYEGD